MPPIEKLKALLNTPEREPEDWNVSISKENLRSLLKLADCLWRADNRNIQEYTDAEFETLVAELEETATTELNKLFLIP